MTQHLQTDHALSMEADQVGIHGKRTAHTAVLCGASAMVEEVKVSRSI